MKLAPPPEPALTPTTAAAPSAAAKSRHPVPHRLRSIDALRGFDMFWILGAATLVKGLEKLNENATTRFLTFQLEHSRWEGIRFYDLIFPLFLFIVGVSMVFSLDRALAEKPRKAVVWQVVRRSAVLFLLGVFYTGGLSHRWPDVALGGVLHRIAACYLFAALIYIFCRKQLALIAGLAAACLLGYWALMAWVPFPDLRLDKPTIDQLAARIASRDPALLSAATPARVHGVYEEGRNLCNYFDFRLLLGKKMSGYYINEGLLSTIPSIALCLFGSLAGRLLKAGNTDDWRKALVLIAAGAAAIVLGWLWGFQFPIIKRIWTSSFVLWTCGYSAIMLGVFYLIVDVWKRDRWCEPFVWIGMNPITLYLLAGVLSFSTVAERLAGGDVMAFFNGLVAGLGHLVVSFVSLGLVFLVAWFLHRHRIFLRV